MKISKLFHWLYASVMLLPIFAIGTTCLINTFNMASKEETEIHYMYETNDVDTLDDLQIKNLYHLDELSATDFVTDNEEFFEHYININVVKLNYVDTTQDGPYIDEIYINNYSNNKENYIQIQFYIFDTGDYVNVSYMLFSNANAYTNLGDVFDDTFTIYDFDFYFEDNDSLEVFKSLVDKIPSKSDYNVIDYVETHNLDTQDVFYNAINKVQESPLFNWAYNSFLVTPFAYIVNLFSMPTNSIIVMLLSYWLAISIIWLVFDLVMYVPLLVHRWLDKGVLE